MNTVQEHIGQSRWKVRELIIGERLGKRPSLPDNLQPEAADSSRLLRVKEQKHEERTEKQAPTVSFRAVGRGTGSWLS